MLTTKTVLLSHVITRRFCEVPLLRRNWVAWLSVWNYDMLITPSTRPAPSCYSTTVNNSLRVNNYAGILYRWIVNAPVGIEPVSCEEGGATCATGIRREDVVGHRLVRNETSSTIECAEKLWPPAEICARWRTEHEHGDVYAWDCTSDLPISSQRCGHLWWPALPKSTCQVTAEVGAWLFSSPAATVRAVGVEPKVCHVTEPKFVCCYQWLHPKRLVSGKLELSLPSWSRIQAAGRAPQGCWMP